MEEDRESEYFGTLEKKESYSEKLLSTHFIEADIYCCLQVIYRNLQIHLVTGSYHWIKVYFLSNARSIISSYDERTKLKHLEPIELLSGI